MAYDIEKSTFRSTMADAVLSDRKAGQVKSELFYHARKCVLEKNGDLKAGRDMFLARCLEQEQWVTSADAGQSKMDKVPDVWVQGKSDCKRALDAGLKIHEIPSYHQMREALNNARKQANGLNTTKADRKTGLGRGQKDRTPVTSVEDALAAGDVLDAKSNIICPEDLLPIVELLKPLPELTRKRTVGQLFSVARAARKNFDDGKAEADRRKTQPTEGRRLRSLTGRTGTNG